jgi:hypothetical protein
LSVALWKPERELSASQHPPASTRDLDAPHVGHLPAGLHALRLCDREPDHAAGSWGLAFLRSGRRRFRAAAIPTNRIRRSHSRLHERAKQQCAAEYERKQCKDKYARPDLVVIMDELPSGIFGHVHILTLIPGRNRLSSSLIEIMTTSETGHYPSWVGGGDCDGSDGQSFTCAGARSPVDTSELRASTTRPTGRNGRGIFDLNQLLGRLDVIHVP